MAAGCAPGLSGSRALLKLAMSCAKWEISSVFRDHAQLFYSLPLSHARGHSTVCGVLLERPQPALVLTISPPCPNNCYRLLHGVRGPAEAGGAAGLTHTVAKRWLYQPCMPHARAGCQHAARRPGEAHSSLSDTLCSSTPASAPAEAYARLSFMQRR